MKMIKETKLRWKEIPRFGLDKIPVESLYRMAKVEIGQLQSYAQELEEKIKSLEKRIDTLEDDRTRLNQLLEQDEEKRALQVAVVEAKKEEYVAGLLKGHLTQQKHIEDLKRTNEQLYLRVFELTKKLDSISVYSG